MDADPATRQEPRTARPPVTEISAALGWRFFAGLLTLLLGILNLIDGLIAITSPDVFAGSSGEAPTLPVTDNLTAWGWTVLVIGVVLIAIAFPLMGGLSWTRIAGIAALSVDVVLQFSFLAHFPLWSLIMIALNVVVIFALATRWAVGTELDR